MASSTEEKVTKPKPRLRPVSRSFRTIYLQSAPGIVGGCGGTYGVDNVAELGEGITEAVISGGPGETAGQVSK